MTNFMILLQALLSNFPNTLSAFIVARGGGLLYFVLCFDSPKRFQRCDIGWLVG